MAVDLKIRNTLDLTSQLSYSSTDYAVGVGTIGVKNTNAFSANTPVQIGNTGEEQTEILIPSSIAGTGIVFSGTTRFAHPIDTPLFSIGFDKLIIKQSTAGTAGTATALTNGTIAITPDSEYTLYSDSTGVSTYAYKTSFYNSATDTESANSDWIVPGGYEQYQLGAIRQRVKNKLFDAGLLKSDEIVDDWINEYVEDLNNAAIQVDQSYSLGSVNVAFGTAGLGTITSADYKEIKRLWVTYDGVNDLRAGHIDITGYWPEDTFTSTHPYYYNYGDNVFGIKPPQSGGTAKVIYYKLQARLVNDGDTLPTSMKAYSKAVVDYCLGEAYFLDNKVDRATEYNRRAQAAKQEFLTQITPRGKDGVEMMQLDYPVNEDDCNFFM